LKKICDYNGLAEYLILSDSAAALRFSRTVENELFLSLVGAIYKDGGMPSARAFVLPKLREVISDDEPELMREAKKDIIKKAGTERDVFSDHSDRHSDTREKRSAASTLKSIFSPRKRKNSTTDTEPQAIASTETVTNMNAPERSPHPTIAITTETPNATVDRRSSKSSASPHRTSHTNSESIGSPKEPSDGNYKSALQEYVQKNIRSATVMLEYRDSRSSDGCTTEVFLFGKKIATASGMSKKEASQNAAKRAYHAITAPRGEAADWFNRLKADPESALSSSEHTAESDYISELNRIYQKKLRRSDVAIKYISIPSKNKKMIAFAVTVGDERLGVGEGKTAKEAKQNAARSALIMLGRL